MLGGRGSASLEEGGAFSPLGAGAGAGSSKGPFCSGQKRRLGAGRRQALETLLPPPAAIRPRPARPAEARGSPAPRCVLSRPPRCHLCLAPGCVYRFMGRF